MLAWAGLHRLGLEHHVTQRLDPAEFLPAIGQGALGLECRGTDTTTLDLLGLLDDPATRRADRRTSSAGGARGGCTLPMGAWARDIEHDQGDPMGPVLAIDAAVFDLDGSTRVAVALRGPGSDPDILGYRAAQALCDQGALPLIKRSLLSSDRF